MAPGGSERPPRNALAAAARLLARSCAATASSSSASVPGSREARQSGNRLNVVRLSGQYQRAMRVPTGVLRAYVPCRASEQPPPGWFGQRARVASRQPRTATYCSPLSPVLNRSCTPPCPGVVVVRRGHLSLSLSVRRRGFAGKALRQTRSVLRCSADGPSARSTPADRRPSNHAKTPITGATARKAHARARRVSAGGQAPRVRHRPQALRAAQLDPPACLGVRRRPTMACDR